MSRSPSRSLGAVLTGEGRGAIAVVRVWGPACVDDVSAVFRPRGTGSLATTPVGQPRVGTILQPASGHVADEVVAVVLSCDPPEVEIHGHAGPAALDAIRHALRGVGVRFQTPLRWMLDHARTRIVAEAMLDLAHATTTRTASILLDQAAGALDRALQELAEDPDPDRLQTLLDRAEIGLRCLTGWRVVLAGRPNVGKSHLLNALAGYERVIVHDQPGTTRDAVSVPLALDGWPVEVFDTAGVRTPTDPIEAEGIVRASQAQDDADLVLLVLDRSEPLGGDDRVLIDRYPRALRVASKADLAPAWDPDRLGAHAVSAARGDGLDALVAAIAARLVPIASAPGDAVPFRRGHLRRLEGIREPLHSRRMDVFRSRIARWTRPRTGGRHLSGMLPL